MKQEILKIEAEKLELAGVIQKSYRLNKEKNKTSKNVEALLLYYFLKF